MILERKNMVTLHKIEKELLLTLRQEKRLTVDEIAKKTGLNEAAIMRSSLWLSSKNLAKISEESESFVQLGFEGEKFQINNLPERRLVNAVLELGKKAKLEDVLEKAGLTKQEGSIALGWAKRKGWLHTQREGETLILEVEKEPEKDLDELLIKLLKKNPTPLGILPSELIKGLDNLRIRPNVVIISTETKRSISLTDKGLKTAQQVEALAEEVSQLTPELIRTGKWRSVKLREFDVKAPGPRFHPAKIHPAEQIIQQVRRIFLQMGFTEIRGSIIETAFWNFDALFQPQDHPAREMMDTFYIAKPKLGKLPNEKIVSQVGKTHENGWITGSTGWGYKWKREEARKLLLRTHTTAETIRFLSKHREIPLKVFSVDRVYRNEKIDYKHLAEFHQIEGIVMDNNVTLRDLMGTLKEFYMKLGLEKVQFWPSYFPYTEPSVQSTVYVPELEAWVELCGMGVFRPEVTKPLGINYPVLAWGGGLERIIMLKLGVEDIRNLYRNDLGWIRSTPTIRGIPLRL